MKRLLLLISFLIFSSAFAKEVVLNTNSIANGKTLYIELKDDKYKDIKFLKKTYKIYKHPTKKNTFYALVPIDYYTKQKNQTLFLNYNQKSKNNTPIKLHVVNGNYKKEKLSVPPGMIKLIKKNKQRVAKEYKEAMKIYKTSTNNSYITSPFILPIHSQITSEFGKARTYNNQLKSYHGGTDFRAKTPTPIKACNDGIVVLAKDRYYAGGSVLIDHGHGIYSCYYHLSKFKVKKGQKIKKGQVIALSGASGRITGPHLHFGIRVNGTQVDPLDFIATVNQNIYKGNK